MPDDMESVLGLVGPVSVYCDWAGSITSLSATQCGSANRCLSIPVRKTHFAHVRTLSNKKTNKPGMNNENKTRSKKRVSIIVSNEKPRKKQIPEVRKEYPSLFQMRNHERNKSQK